MNELATNLRASLIRTLSCIAEESAQKEYKEKVTFVHVPLELFAQWDSAYGPRHMAWFTGAFSENEREALDAFQKLICKQLPEPSVLRDVPDVFVSHEWMAVRDGAAQLLKVLGE
ncbi:MAG: hypothetical protein IPN38_09685 [Flavobacteriales bacterium]|nr:hypothetical protein [Flavobacteriales bacterium]